MATRRRLVTLPLETAAAVGRFRKSEDARTERCQHCGAVLRINATPPSESAALRRLIGEALDSHEREMP